jgi:hypothetical protein
MMSRTTPRFTALLLGFAAEIYLGGTLLVWLTSPNAAGRAPFGPVASKAMLIAAMVALALAMVALAFATRLGKVVLRTCVMVVSLPVACAGALAIGSLFSDPGGPFLLLAAAWICSVLVVVAISRTERA